MKAKLIIRHILWAFLIIYFASTIQETATEKPWFFWVTRAVSAALLAAYTYSKRDKSTEQ